MPFVRVGGLDLHYEEHGTGPHVLVMAHGALGSVAFADAFGLSAAALAARGLRVVAYDARGHGRSGAPTAASAYDKRLLADELCGLVDALSLARVSICGTSMGATSALLFAQEHPDRIERLVLRSPAPFGADMIGPRRRLSALAWSYQLLGTQWTARLASLWPDPGGALRLRTLLQGQRRVAVVPVLRGFLAAPLDVERLDRISAPALILTQRGDALHPLRSGEILRDTLRHGTLCVAPSMAFWDGRVGEAADLIAAFVRGEWKGDSGVDVRRRLRNEGLAEG